MWSVDIKNIRSELNFDTFYPYDDVDYRELEKPFQIHIDVFLEYLERSYHVL